MTATPTIEVRVSHSFDAPPERVFDAYAWLDVDRARRFL